MKKIIISLSFIIVILELAMPLMSSASVLAPFGGLDVAMVPCTCEGGALSWQWFAPLHLGPVAMTGALIAPLVVAFSTYYVRPATWALGTYIPGAGEACWVGVEPYCSMLPALGIISPETGVSPSL